MFKYVDKFLTYGGCVFRLRPIGIAVLQGSKNAILVNIVVVSVNVVIGIYF